MPTEQRLKHSKGSDSGSDVSTSSPGRPHKRKRSVEEPPTPTSPLQVKAKKRKAHFEDDPVNEPLPQPFPHYQPNSAISPISHYCVCPPEPHIPRPRNGKYMKVIVLRLGQGAFDVPRGCFVRAQRNKALTLPAFILYRSAQAADITAKDPRVSNPEQSKIIAKEWNSLSEEEKLPWKDLAEVRLDMCFTLSACLHTDM